MLVDIHTHIHEFPPEEIPLVLERAKAASVGVVFLAGTTLESSAKCITVANTDESGSTRPQWLVFMDFGLCVKLLNQMIGFNR